jgi:hypothetical protein
MVGLGDEAIRFVGLKSILVIGLFALGCGAGTDKREKQLQKELGETPQRLANLAGKVTVDGAPPAFGSEHPVQVILYDLKNPPTPANPPLYTLCSDDGSFKFMARATESGVPEGSYVVLFAALKHARVGAYREPDALKNLYNDPDKNQEDPNFKIDSEGPRQGRLRIRSETCRQLPDRLSRSARHHSAWVCKKKVTRRFGIRENARKLPFRTSPG